MVEATNTALVKVRDVKVGHITNHDNFNLKDVLKGVAFKIQTYRSIEQVLK